MNPGGYQFLTKSTHAKPRTVTNMVLNEESVLEQGFLMMERPNHCLFLTEKGFLSFKH